MADHVWRSILKRLEWPEPPVFGRQEIAGWDPVFFDPLLQTGILAETSPATAVECSECEEGCIKQVAIHRYGESVQGFIYCERFGRIETDLDDLRRWVVKEDNFTRQIAKAMNLTGEVEEISRGTWFLGHRYVARRRRDFFFLRFAIVNALSKTSISRYSHPVIFVPATLPEESFLAGAHFFCLTQFSSLAETGINMDMPGIEAALSSGKQRELPQVVPFPTPFGTQWEQVAIRFVSDESVRISVKGISKEVSFAEMGLKDRRKGHQPNKLWLTLLLFAKYNGQIAWGDPISREHQTAMKHNVSELRKYLKSYFGIDNDPFYPYKAVRSYRTRFVIEDARYGG